MMEQLAERRMQREEDAAGAIEAESDEDSEDDGDGSDRDDDGEDDGASEDDEDDEDEEDGDEEVHSYSILLFTQLIILFSFFLDHVRRAKDGGRQTNVFHLCCAHVRTTCTASIPRESRSGTSATASPRT